MQRIRLALVSCGLGNVYRGFEVSTSRWHQSLLRQKDLNVRLFCGGYSPDCTHVWNVNRDGFLASPLAYNPFISDRRRWEISYILEQLSFAFGLLPEISKWRPDVIWTKEVPLAHVLAVFRAVLGLKYKIIFANGAPFSPGTYSQFDFIQQLQPDAYEQALRYGIPQHKMQVLPNCVPVIQPIADRLGVRKSFGYLDNDWIVICVAAWNQYHKRIDYLIDEVAAMNDSAVKLLLCGHPETETEVLRVQAAEKLGDRVKWLTLPAHEVIRALQMADVFVLPSLYEGLGSALIEAAMVGLPVISHPHAGSRFILADEFWLTDLSQPGNLARQLAAFKAQPPSATQLQVLVRQATRRFCDETLSGEFCQMVRKVLGNDSSMRPVTEVMAVAQKAKQSR